ncbi:hypothetical protein B0H16DRAFT_1349266 [Mycena metata]|uniref:Uncharacterized protein n=1 Tax=Mycena metata TaxID=1033252 RepID=A0AAD7DUK3_9AGAR|nr:hypothetical protein B0H16DRAFT_1349266 [Mycena metata]
MSTLCGRASKYTLLPLCLTSLILPRHPLLILDRHGRIIAVFAGAPEDPEWPSVIRNASTAMKEVQEEGFRLGVFASEDETHRRGSTYVPFPGGISHGGGQLVPMSKNHRYLFNKLIQNKFIRRACGFQSSIFGTFAPKLFCDYITYLQPLFDHDPNLRHNFTNSIFPAVTFNLGPQSVTFGHVDHLNRPDGWCVVTNDGDFDYKRSAHLYLKQLKLVVEFPPAATAAIPSAVIEHGNTPLAPDETRYSITQYAAGGLFRYVKYGFRTVKQLLKQKGGQGLKAAYDGAPGERHAAGLDLFSKVDELAADHAACFGR